MNIHDVTPEMVRKVYLGRHMTSGRHGCACGCRGKYYYSSSPRPTCRLVAEVNDKMVKRVLNLFKKNASLVEFENDFFWFDKPGADRTYTVYLKEEAK